MRLIVPPDTQRMFREKNKKLMMFFCDCVSAHRMAKAVAVGPLPKQNAEARRLETEKAGRMHVGQETDTPLSKKNEDSDHAQYHKLFWLKLPWSSTCAQ